MRHGTQVFVRPIHADDRELERTFIKRMSPGERRLSITGHAPVQRCLSHRGERFAGIASLDRVKQ